MHTHILYIQFLSLATLHSLTSLYECCTIFLLFVLAEDNFDAIAWRMAPFVLHPKLLKSNSFYICCSCPLKNNLKNFWRPFIFLSDLLKGFSNSKNSSKLRILIRSGMLGQYNIQKWSNRPICFLQAPEL